MRFNFVFSITAGRFIKLSKALVQVLPSEETVSYQVLLLDPMWTSNVMHLCFLLQESYYVPYQKVNDVSFNAKGKFVTQYYHWRSLGLRYRLLNNTTRAACTSRGLCMLYSCFAYTNIFCISFSFCFLFCRWGWCLLLPSSGGAGGAGALNEDTAASLTWLQLNCGPQTLAQLHWEKVHQYRLENFQNDRSTTTLSEIFSEYPCLRQPWAYSLVSIWIRIVFILFIYIWL